MHLLLRGLGPLLALTFVVRPALAQDAPPAAQPTAPGAPAQGGYPPPPGAYPAPGQPAPGYPGYSGYPPPAPSRPPPPREEEETEFKSLAIEANPLGILISRYSLNIEWLPAVHHALIATPHYDHVVADLEVVDSTGQRFVVEDSFTGFGVELGYRFYNGSKGPNGFYVGPSVLLGAYSTDGSDLTGAGARDFTTYGWAIDFGGQAVIGPGIVIGGGGGFQYTWVSEEADQFGELPLSAEVLVGGGFRPRALFSIGYAF